MRQEDLNLDKQALEDFLVRNDIALIKVVFFRERFYASKADDSKKALPRRNDIELHQKLSGTRLRGLWTDSAPPGGRRELFVVSHAWLSLEHPDPLGVRLEALLDDLRWLKATDEDLIFFDYCSLYEADDLHEDCKNGSVLPKDHPSRRSASEEQLFQTAKRYMDVLFGSCVPKVIIMPEIYDVEKAHVVLGKHVTANTNRYIERGWCGLEFSLACRAGTVAASARPLFGRRHRNSDDLIDIEEIDYEEMEVHIHNFESRDGKYKQRTEFEGAPYYEQEGGKHFLYMKEERKWLIGTKLGAIEGDSVWSDFSTQDDEPPCDFWKVKDQKHHDVQVFQMKPDDKYMVQGLCWLREAGNGEYCLQGDMNGRPYYANEEGVFIYVLKNGLWCISPVLGSIGSLVWADNKSSMPKPPEGNWKVVPLVCPDIRVSRSAQGTKIIVNNFGWIREKGNGAFSAAGMHSKSPYYTNEDGTVFIYRWREKRWRISNVLGATGIDVVDQITASDLIPPTIGWTHAYLVVLERRGGEQVALTGARATRLQGKVRILASTDGEEWKQLALIQEGFTDFETPVLARFVRVTLEKDLAWIRCLVEGGVEYRNSPDFDDVITAYSGPKLGNKVPVQSRQGAWIKAEKGWLPLYVDGRKAFEGISGSKEEPWACAVVGYRLHQVQQLPEVMEFGIRPGQFADVRAAGAVSFAHEEDADIVLPMYTRNFAPRPRAALLSEVLAAGNRSAVKNIGEVRDAVQDLDGRIVRTAVKILARFGSKLYPPDIEAVGALLASPDGYLREAAAAAMGRIGISAAPYAEALCRMLSDPDVGAQVAAAAALAHLGDGARSMAAEAAEHLVEMLRHPDREKRISACEALSQMGDIGAAHVDSLIRLLDDGFLPVRHAVVSALGLLGEAGGRHATKLVPLLRDPHLRHVSVIALMRLNAYQADVGALLFAQEWFVRRDVLLALAAFGEGAAIHEEGILPLLADVHRDVRVAALGVLVVLPAASASRAADVVQALADGAGEDLDIRRAAEVVLLKLMPAPA